MRILPCLVLFAALPAAAQNVRLADKTALLFNIGGLMTSTPTALDGVGVGGRMFLDDQMAVRAAVGISRVTDATEQSGGGFSQDTENVVSTIALEGGLEWALMRAKSAYLYTGGLLQLGYGATDPEGDDNDGSNVGLTAAGLLGATYFLMEGLSIGAEYRLGLQYQSVEQEQGSGSKSERTSTIIGVGAAGFHLGFWF